MVIVPIGYDGGAEPGRGPARRGPGALVGDAAAGGVCSRTVPRYHDRVVAIAILPVMVFVWVARRMRLRREQRALDEQLQAEAEARRYEESVIADMERRLRQ